MLRNLTSKQWPKISEMPETELSKLEPAWCMTSSVVNYLIARTLHFPHTDFRVDLLWLWNCVSHSTVSRNLQFTEARSTQFHYVWYPLNCTISHCYNSTVSYENAKYYHFQYSLYQRKHLTSYSFTKEISKVTLKWNVSVYCVSISERKSNLNKWKT